MKKIITVSALLMLATLLSGCFSTTTMVSGSSSMSSGSVRTHARFLTDRMAYELDLTPMQYDDCYEINYDFIYYVSSVMNDVTRGYYDAINTYYRYLDYRNDDLRYIMTGAQYVRFLSKEYFYRPIYTTGSSWSFRVYTIYSNRSFYYYDAPTIFKSYRGGHSRTYYSGGYYNSRYGISDRYMGNPRIMGSGQFKDTRRNDFGSNLRDRNQKPDYNNYSNRNSNNRTADPRYRDNSGNTHSPQINYRTGNGSGERRGGQTGNQPGGQQQTGSQPKSNGQGQQGTQSKTSNRNQSQGTTTGTRSGNTTPQTSTRGNRSTTGR